MTVNQQIKEVDRYISHARKQINQQERVMKRARRKATIDRAQDLVVLLSALLANVERQRNVLAGPHR